jgi:hypothetical protein
MLEIEQYYHIEDVEDLLLRTVSKRGSVPARPAIFNLDRRENPSKNL